MKGVIKLRLAKTGPAMALLMAVAAFLVCTNAYAAGNVDALVAGSFNSVKAAQESGDPIDLENAMTEAENALNALADAVEGAAPDELQALLNAYVVMQNVVADIASAADAIGAESIKSRAAAAQTSLSTPMDALITAGADLSAAQDQALAYQPPSAPSTPAAAAAAGPASLAPGTVAGGGGGGGGGGTGINDTNPASPI
ncbi:hypothetical protein SAMN02745216_03866 [Desulfatibacillum alkenivorans DSM 16219]|jgi:hypothetical protein|uniref:Uncharacterized protein n=1 Tax=Desulfatibacillum alkenivorans DSM 16219 TaxID=1121393 RepID=A0A1M6UCL6_9BACT|nr:hypothetical protein [Desulfatibacillum alkenivorans]SHK66995.1 hypothetical protein SAMN02745216_03866 [Desulfatibacillum alkenivorans DSM 16219]